jgi:hypothetical protein
MVNRTRGRTKNKVKQQPQEPEENMYGAGCAAVVAHGSYLLNVGARGAQNIFDFTR